MHTYYALRDHRAVTAVQLKIFSAIHVERQRLDSAENIAAFVGKNGVDAAKFLAPPSSPFSGRDGRDAREEAGCRLQGRQRADADRAGAVE
jgi:hypothetical protein